MENTSTAKKFLENLIEENNHDSNIDLEDALIEFAKMHVETALYIASEMADLTDNGRFPYVDKTSILNSYSLDNIK
jgi:hypothetical protein